jgi:hypothetical protein
MAAASGRAMQRRASLGAASVLLVFVACRNERNLGSFPDGGGGAGPSPVPAHFQQVTCHVTRTECSGFAEDDSGAGLDGLDVNCPTANLVQNVQFDATACYLTQPSPDAGTGQLTQEQNDAKSACAQYCADGYGAQHTYPLGAVANQPGSMVTCTSTVDLTTIQEEVNGQCSKVQLAADAGDPGNVMFVNCHIGGRACNGSEQSAKDGTQYCTDTPLLSNGQETSTCYDPTTTTAELACQSNWLWPMTPPNAVNDQDWFHWVFVNAPIQEDNEADCQIQANNIEFAGLGIARGPSGRPF